MRPSFYERHSFKILLIAALCYGPTMVGAFRALKSNKNDVAQWLPAQYDETRVFKWFRDHFAGEQFMLVSWDGCTLDDQRLRMMVAKLVPVTAENDSSTSSAEIKQASVAGRPHYFDEVTTGRKLLERLTSDPINLSEEDGLKRLEGTLIGADGKTTCLVLTLSEEGKEHLRETVNLVRRTASQECNIAPEKLHMGGAPVDNVAIDEAGERSLFKLAGFAAAIGLVISWWCLRSPRLIMMVFFVGIYGAAASLAIVWWSPLLLGHEPGWIRMNAILLTMPSLVYVATISGAIHLSNYYRDVLAEGAPLHGAPEAAIKHAALPVTLATVTTAVGLLTLCYSELVPIQLFGLYSAAGVVVSVLLLFFVLPACFQTWPLHFFVRPEGAHGHAETERRGAGGIWFDIAAVRIWRHLGEGIIRRHGLVTFGSLVILGICGYGLTKIETSVHLMRLFPPDAKILADYKWLEQNLGDLVPMEVVLKIDPQKSKLDFLERMELVEKVQNHLKDIPEVGGVLSAVTFAPKLPKAEDFKPAARGGLGGVFKRLAVKNEYALTRKITAKKLAEHRNEYIEGDYLADEDGIELWRISARVGALKDVDYGIFLQDIPKHVEPVLAAELKERKVDGGVQAVYTGLVPLVYKAQRSLLDGLIWGFVSDFILITIVMMVAVRDWSAGLILALPSIFPAVVIFGLMGWLGIVVDIGSVMAPSVALGVTVDDVVHFMIQYRGGLKQGLSRQDSVMLAYKGCAQAMYQSWGVIGLGLSVFAFSPFTPTQRFGYMMVTLLTSALVGNLLLLPALLAGPLGGLFGRRFTKKKASPTAEAERQAAPAAAMRLHPHESLTTDHARRGINA